MSDKGITHYVGDDCQGGHYQDSRIANLERQLEEAQGTLVWLHIPVSVVAITPL